ncbi:hypothetical protein EB796_024371 [Bugula neritina]|uniref:Uncharacterized protein n=1 Tax=Bugula neritina TaxID=10212 RepID=A0A7J7IV66_BUGNE|nr:hypothetical protein EB796_024371 [Bugula neritina]
MMDTNADTDITNLDCEAMSVESTEITITDTSEHVNPDPLWEVLPNTPLLKLLDETSKEASVNISMLLLPVLTIVSGLMGISTVSTHRDEINFSEPNIIWSAVAAPPGSRKTVALNKLKKVLVGFQLKNCFIYR